MFIIKQTMTIPFKIRVGNLLFKFFTHTLIFFGTRKTARAITARAL